MTCSGLSSPDEFLATVVRDHVRAIRPQRQTTSTHSYDGLHDFVTFPFELVFVVSFQFCRSLEWHLSALVTAATGGWSKAYAVVTRVVTLTVSICNGRSFYRVTKPNHDVGRRRFAFRIGTIHN